MPFIEEGTKGIQDRIMNLADYNGEERNRAPAPSNYNINNNKNRSNNDVRNNNSVIRDALMQFNDVILKYIQR